MSLTGLGIGGGSVGGGGTGTVSGGAAGNQVVFTGAATVAAATSINKTTTYTVLAGDSLITADATGGAFTITLPAATATRNEYTIVKTDASANAVTVSRAGADLIQGATTYILNTQYAGRVFTDTASAKWNLTPATASAFSDLAGIATVTQGGTGANLSTTGGAEQIVKQNSSGGVFTVGMPESRMTASLLTSSTAIANTTTQTAYSKTYTIPAGSLNAAGTVLKVSCGGSLATNAAASMGNIIWRVRLAGVSFCRFDAPVIGGNFAAAGNSTSGWNGTAQRVVWTTGATGTMRDTPQYGTYIDGGYLPAQNTPSTPTVDLTAALVVDVTATFSIANAGNTTTLDYLNVEIFQPANTIA